MRIYTFSRLGLDGRCGNQLYQVAATLSAAQRDKGSQARIPADWEYRDYVNLPPRFYKPPEQEDELVDLAADRTYGPYYQRLQDIQGVDCKKRFALSKSAELRFNERHGKLLEEPYPFCAVHVRRGDYLQDSERFPVLQRHYYEQAVKSVLDALPSVRFLVFSDDPSFCRDNPEEIGVYGWPYEVMDADVTAIPVRERVKERTDILDMWMIAKCKAIIMGNSTFSWWGAYLSEAEFVSYPSVWFGPSIEKFEGFLPEWNQIEC